MATAMWYLPESGKRKYISGINSLLLAGIRYKSNVACFLAVMEPVQHESIGFKFFYQNELYCFIVKITHKTNCFNQLATLYPGELTGNDQNASPDLVFLQFYNPAFHTGLLIFYPCRVIRKGQSLTLKVSNYYSSGQTVRQMAVQFNPGLAFRWSKLIII